LRELVGVRFRELPPAVRRVLLAAGALTRPHVEQLVRLEPGAERALRVAVEAGIVELVGGNVRFTHPLFALLPYDELAPAARRRLHRRLSEVAASAEERARHAALSVARPDATVAAGLDHAAESAGARGAPETAAELSALAARLTPWDAASERWERTLNAAEWHERAGELESAASRADEVLDADVAAAPSTRARALMLLGTIRGDIEGVDAARELYLRALHAGESSPQLCAEIHHKLAWTSLVGGQAALARRHAQAARRLAPSADPAVAAAAAATAALIEVARTGVLPRRVLDRALALERSARATRPGVWGETAPSVLEGVTALWAGELERARGPLEQMHATAIESGDPWLLMHSLAYLSALETSLGRPREGLSLARRYLELAAETEQDAQRASALWPFAAAAAMLGSVTEARDAVAVGLEIAERTGHRLYLLGCLAAQGELELSLGEFASAAEVLWRARELARESGIVAVGRVSILPNAVEALLQVGELERVQRVTADLEAQATKVGRPWAVALAQRSSGLAAAARGDWAVATQSFDQALSNHALQPRPLERARTQLSLGVTLRRAGAKREARLAIECAEETFGAAGATLWAKQAQDELRRIGGRSAPAGSALSATESRIAELVAAGRTNAETAQTLRLSPRTVEWNLSKIYRKLSVRSRSELAAGLRRTQG
jgi:DNA-binding CsgD family transcriptional regulator